MPVIAQDTVGPDCVTAYGASPEDARARSTGGRQRHRLIAPSARRRSLDAIERMATVTRVKLSAQPNAGIAARHRRPVDDMASPEYMAHTRAT